jgi:hypothetical protein
MKTRHGFVSNSSSSSYIIVLPDDFKIKTNSKPAKILFDVFKKKTWLNYDEFDEFKGKLKSSEFYEGWDELHVILKKYMVQDIQTSADGVDCIVLIPNDKIRKIWEDKQ